MAECWPMTQFQSISYKQKYPPSPSPGWWATGTGLLTGDGEPLLSIKWRNNVQEMRGSKRCGPANTDCPTFMVYGKVKFCLVLAEMHLNTSTFSSYPCLSDSGL